MEYYKWTEKEIERMKGIARHVFSFRSKQREDDFFYRYCTWIPSIEAYRIGCWPGVNDDRAIVVDRDGKYVVGKANDPNGLVEEFRKRYRQTPEEIAAKRAARQIARQENFAVLLAQAQEGDARAQCSVASEYERGMGGAGKADMAQAAYWYEKAVENGDAKAMWSLARCYQHEELGPDITKACEWFGKYADHYTALAAEKEEGRRWGCIGNAYEAYVEMVKMGHEGALKEIVKMAAQGYPVSLRIVEEMAAQGHKGAQAELQKLEEGAYKKRDTGTDAGV